MNGDVSAAYENFKPFLSVMLRYPGLSRYNCWYVAGRLPNAYIDLADGHEVDYIASGVMADEACVYSRDRVSSNLH